MTVDLIKNENIHCDIMGNTRNVIVVTLTYGYSERYEYVTKAQYKLWLRTQLSNFELDISHVNKMRDKTVYDTATYKSFYTIIYDYCGWIAMFVVQGSTPGTGFYVTESFINIIDALDFMKNQPPNHDFEIVVTGGESEYFQMTEENMVLAVLKYSDYETLDL